MEKDKTSVLCRRVMAMGITPYLSVSLTKRNTFHEPLFQQFADYAKMLLKAKVSAIRLDNALRFCFRPVYIVTWAVL